jgi:hypothetical protein
MDAAGQASRCAACTLQLLSSGHRAAGARGNCSFERRGPVLGKPARIISALLTIGLQVVKALLKALL